MEDDETGAASTAAQTAGQPGTVDGPASVLGSGDHLLELERARDMQNNANTRRPDGEVITFRSMTIVEMYAGQAVDQLVVGLEAMEWLNTDEPVVDRIREAQKGYLYSWGVFWIAPPTSHGGSTLSYARAPLPTGVTQIYAEYNVLGPSLVALVLTFVLAAPEATSIDAAIREDVESRLERFGLRSVSIRTVRDVKKERVRAAREDVRKRCEDWITAAVPGTLSAVEEGLGPPTCALISLKQGTPFGTHAGYMTLVDLVNDWLAERFVSPDCLYLAYPIDISPNNRMTGAFNEGDALSQPWLHNVGAAPELFHGAISSLMIADGIYAVLRSYEAKLRDVRTSLNRLDFEKVTGPEVIALRSRLLGISRDIATVSSDVSVLVNDPGAIWTDLLPMVPLRQSGSPSATPDATAAAKRRMLTSTVASLQSEEANLRELILVTSSSTSEVTGLDLQTKVLNLTNKLNDLTTWLTILTVVLVILGLVTLVVQLVHNPVVHVQFPTAPRPSGITRPG
jgi:hypothetical protein